ncbi:MAG TPA: thiamine pyrophosphate-binding protein [Polyangiaceae bacterium]
MNSAHIGSSPTTLKLVPSVSPAKPSRAIDVCVRYLRAEGVDTVFGIPGGLLHPFFEALEATEGMQVVMSKHEEGAAFMADGYARTTGKLAVCAGTSGPGATNLVTGVACAFADGVPMLVVTGQAASHALGKGAAQETTREDIDIVEMFRPITKYSAMVTSPESFAQHLRRALRLAFSGRPGPVHLNVPVDVWEKPAQIEEKWFDPKTYRPETRTFDRDAVRRAGDALLAAKNPVFLVGSGVRTSNAAQHVKALADMLPARVATTPRAKGIYAEDDAYSLGVFGVAGHRDARDVILGDDVDVLFAIGTSLGETSTLNWNAKMMPSKTFIQLDIDPSRIGRNFPVDIGLAGDAQSILVELVYHLHRKIRDGAFPESKWNGAILPMRGHERYDESARRTSEAAALTPERWRWEMSEVLPGRSIVFSDIGGHMLFNLHHLCMRDEQEFYINLGFGSMGHGTVAPIGAAIAHPGRPVFAIVGDGCFTMNGMEILTAAEHDVPVVWIVENNQGHNITHHCSKILSGGTAMRAARYKHKLDVAKMADAMGVASFVVDGPGQMARALGEALKVGGPAVIEVRVDGEIPPPMGARAKSLAGFIES